MRKLKRNPIITIRAIKRHKQMLLSDLGRSFLIESDVYTDNIPVAEWRFWILKRANNKYKVIKAIPQITP